MIPQDLYKLITPIGGSMLYLEEGLALHRAAREISMEANGYPIAVEIGSFTGMSTTMIADGLGPYGVLVAIDPHDGQADSTNYKPDCPPTIEPMRQALKLAQVESRVAIIPSFSHSAYRTVGAVLKDRKLDLLFIDGGHTEEEVFNDLRLYVPLLKYGGILAMDDLGYSTVGAAWARWNPTSHNVQPIDLMEWGICDNTHNREHEGCVHKMAIFRVFQ